MKRAQFLSKWWGRQENNTSVCAIAYNSSTDLSICLISLLQWQTAPQPFAMIAEPFQLKDKIQTHACYLEVSLTAIHPLEDFERAGEAHPPVLPLGTSGGCTIFFLLRRKSQLVGSSWTRWKPLPIPSWIWNGFFFFSLEVKIPFSYSGIDSLLWFNGVSLRAFLILLQLMHMLRHFLRLSCNDYIKIREKEHEKMKF